ncbi:hypothetical protein [Microcystis aeruginosa]|uniref:Uncharacterized protein n=1 Tax=Microcystis aeruginosa PCC 9443 TaxID=1160281 RepID=I4G8J4_MICAE|nr:hypothetical protein [Microcystis aeruginosa]CCI04255.1 conserved hypothetical protein [Microcystis aeruginosa PCC 9443]
MEYISSALRLEFREFCRDALALRQIDDIFQMAGIQRGQPERVLSGERRSRVEEYYASIDWTDLIDTQKFLKVIGLVLSQSYISDGQKDFLRNKCIKEGLVVEGQQVQLPQITSPDATDDLFMHQFPGGLPFGLAKPEFAVTAKKGKQSLKFELKSGIGIIWRDVYPNFDFPTFQAACGINSETNLALKKALLAMNQTECEKTFFLSYAKYFRMADNHIPILIPQAWIQWYSSSKKVLQASGSSLAKELYRVDFVAFWNNHRYAILIDDISHYAIKHGNQWIADEKTYSKRLEEDRTLQVEGWKIFRVSNWEVRQNKVGEIVTDLQKFIGF